MPGQAKTGARPRPSPRLPARSCGCRAPADRAGRAPRGWQRPRRRPRRSPLRAWKRLTAARVPGPATPSTSRRRGRLRAAPPAAPRRRDDPRPPPRPALSAAPGTQRQPRIRATSSPQPPKRGRRAITFATYCCVSGSIPIRRHGRGSLVVRGHGSRLVAAGVAQQLPRYMHARLHVVGRRVGVELAPRLLLDPVPRAGQDLHHAACVGRRDRRRSGIRSPATRPRPPARARRRDRRQPSPMSAAVTCTGSGVRRGSRDHRRARPASAAAPAAGPAARRRQLQHGPGQQDGGRIEAVHPGELTRRRCRCARRCSTGCPRAGPCRPPPVGARRLGRRRHYRCGGGCRDPARLHERRCPFLLPRGPGSCCRRPPERPPATRLRPRACAS